VLLEKPFAVDLAAAQKIADTAAEADRLLMLGMNQRFERNVQRARLLASAGTFGDVYHIKAFWRRRQGIPRIGSWFTSKAAAGGGALLDIGVHVLDVALHVIDNFRAETVSAATFTRFGNRGIGEFEWGRSERSFEGFDVEDFATAMIRLEGGVALTLEAAWALHQPQRNDHDVVLFGDLAGMSVYNDEVFLNDQGSGYRIVQQAATPPLPAPHCNRAHHFVNVLLGDEQPLVRIDEALAVQRILDAIYQSAASGREVVL
jgi:predicted dehydrogenase